MESPTFLCMTVCQRRVACPRYKAAFSYDTSINYNAHFWIKAGIAFTSKQHVTTVCWVLCSCLHIISINMILSVFFMNYYQYLTAKIIRNLQRQLTKCCFITYNTNSFFSWKDFPIIGTFCICIFIHSGFFTIDKLKKIPSYRLGYIIMYYVDQWIFLIEIHRQGKQLP